MRLSTPGASSRLLGVFNILITCLLLSSCSGNLPQAPVSDRQQPPSIKLKTHRVSAGETLYSIAWRYGLDYHRLASHNRIPTGYTIYPGQLLRLDVDQSTTNKRAVASVAKPSQHSKTPVRSKKTTTKPTKPKVNQQYHHGFDWRWPARGQLLLTFASANGLNKGIDIAGKLGEPVISAGPGAVVYSGSGLRGYGKLLIIKHNEKFLSAYAHNRKLLVTEGDAVRAGQKIAEIGSSGTDRNKLHFEIRRDGKPVDPLKYLPSR